MSWLLATFVLVFAADRATKALAFGRLRTLPARGALGFSAIQPALNARPALWPAGAPLAWAVSFALGFAAALALVALEPRPSWALCTGLGAALGGALGNLYDRLRHGAVLDFLHVGVGGRFNTADVALVAGLSAALVSHVAGATSILWRG